MNKVKYWNAIVIALIGGGIGLQEFYLGRHWLGVAALLFFWTGIPAVVALIEALIWLFDGEDDFYKSIKKDDVKKPLNS